jgi:hypothetical protein
MSGFARQSGVSSMSIRDQCTYSNEARIIMRWDGKLATKTQCRRSALSQQSDRTRYA